ncbi:host attachment family protein [Sphingomonas bacterium]|uniref:host attachment family protein n=1 Tax=Sphingomonas bacterium TaxID=1895847 RepID=UPI001575E050|nr:host attachment family protein [Sphingomonas bacterium]
MELAHNIVVLVADGRKLLFLRNEGDAAHPNLTVEQAEEHPNPATRDQATDAAGRASSTTPAGGTARTGSSVEPTDFHQLEEDRFAATAADLLKTRALAHQYDALVVVAPPKTLGELRKHYHSEVAKRVVGELAKDLTGHPIDQIEAALKAA